MIGQQSIDFKREMHLSGKNKTDSFIEKLIEKNQQIEVLYLSRNLITAAGILHLNKGDWSKLTILSLISNQIGNKGCKLLSKSPLKSIRLIALDDNNIDSAGVLHLSKAKWPELQQGISLCYVHYYKGSNKIAFDSCKWINRAKWTPSKIQLQRNYLKLSQVMNFVLIQPTKVIYFFLGFNMESIRKINQMLKMKFNQTV